MHIEIIFAIKSTDSFPRGFSMVQSKKKKVKRKFSLLVHICDIVQLKFLLLLDIYLTQSVSQGMVYHHDDFFSFNKRKCV